MTRRALIVLTTLVVFASTGDGVWGQRSNNTLQFKLGLLIPWGGIFDEYSGITSASAVSMAIEDINLDDSLNQRMNFSVITYDSGCNSKTAIGNAVSMLINDEIDAFIGPPCSVALNPVGKMASVYDKAIISWVGADADFNDKTVFTTLGRTLGPFNKMGLFLVDVFNRYGWSNVVVLSSTYDIWLDAGKAITRVFNQQNITIAYSATFERYVPHGTIERVLEKTSHEGRIIILVASKDNRRRIMLKAHDMGMTNGEYVFYTVDMLPNEEVLTSRDIWQRDDDRDDDARDAYEAVFHVSLAGIRNARVASFRAEVARRMRLPPWNAYVPSSFDISDLAEGDRFSPFLYDAIWLYAHALNDSISEGLDARSGNVISRKMRGKTSPDRIDSGMTGNLVMDENGDREPDYWIADMGEDGQFVTIAQVINTGIGEKETWLEMLPPRWPNGKVGRWNAPPDFPKCGFRGELCIDEGVPIWLIIMITMLVCAGIAGVSLLGLWNYRRFKFESELQRQSWRIKWEDVQLVKSRNFSPQNRSVSSLSGSDVSRSVLSDHRLGGSQGTMLSGMTNQVFGTVAIAKGRVVFVKKINKDHLQLTRQVLLEFNQVKNLTHENLNMFVGACVDAPNICLTWHYCSRGSLQDVLADDSTKLDNTFKLSFMSDLANGMRYIHSSVLVSHGNLKSSNCLVDKRWILKITDYGTSAVIRNQTPSNGGQDDEQMKKLWTAPELLRQNDPHQRGTQKGDVYSFAIVLFETMTRDQPYSFNILTPRDVVNRVRNGESVPFRPILPECSDLSGQMVRLIRNCWDESPESRPSFSCIQDSVRDLAGGEINILDNILVMMEKYAVNLEEIVNERTKDLVDEKNKTDRLLCQLLPSPVAAKLKAGLPVPPDNYDQSTIFFSDIVGFTSISADSEPLDIVLFLNDLYMCFDTIIERHDVYKVETVGDAYMLVSGVPVRNGNRHAAEIANVSLDLLRVIPEFEIRHRPGQELQLRIGIHSGPCVAGVVGNTMPRYCLFGEAVSMAAKLESSGKPLRVHLSKTSYLLLKEHNVYEMSERGEMTVPGRGLITTYWLHGDSRNPKPLPVLEAAPSEPTWKGLIA